MKTVKIILANAPIKNGNKGCVALSVSIMFLIDRILSSRKINYELYLPDSGYRDSKKHCYSVGEKEFVFFDCEYPCGLNFKESVKKQIKSLMQKEHSPKSIFKNADYIFDIGQGDSFADVYGERRFQIIDRIHVVARSLKKSYCMLPQTIGPFENMQIKEKAILSIAKSKLCMTRDKQSLRFIQENIPQKKGVKEFVDVAFLLPYKRIDLGPGFIHVGLNVSGLLWNGGYTRDNQFGLKSDYHCVIRSIIDYFLLDPKVKLHLISHVASGERNVENDYAVCYDLWREYNNANLVIAPFSFGPVEAKNYIAGLDFFMGARMHATIAAFSSGIPVVPMAYSRKFNGLFVETLDYPYLVDLKEQNLEEIMSVLPKHFGNRQEMKELIAARMNGVVKQSEKEVFEELSKYMINNG